jgi:hypothetical protein
MGIPLSRGTPRRTQDVRVDPEQAPGWVTAAERMPASGERVLTNEGPAVVIRAFGRTTDGKRLLELAMDDGRKTPFFAAAVNIMVPAQAGGELPKVAPAE